MLSWNTVIKRVLGVYAKLRCSRIFWRDRRVVSFFSEPPYSGNARALYEYMKHEGVDKRYGLELVWLVQSKEWENILKRYGVDACYVRRYECIRMYLCSRVHVADTFIMNVRRFVKGPRTIFLLTWHGIPFKTVLRHCWPQEVNRIVDYSIATSTYTAMLTAASVGICPAKIRVTGYPRNDRLLLRTRREALQILSQVLGRDVNNFERIILYAPTYRHGDAIVGREYVEGAPMDTLANIPLDYLRELDRVLERYRALLIVKYHHIDEIYYERKATRLFEERIRGLQTHNIRLVTSSELGRIASDVYDIFPAIDVLITDYSSIFYDYLLLDRPVIFYMYDLEKYIKDRGLIIDVEALPHYVPGPIAKTPRQLIELVRRVLEDGDIEADKRRALTRLVHRYRDSGSSRRVWEQIVKKHVAD